MPISEEQMRKLKEAIVVICKIAAENGFKLLSIPLSKIIFFADRDTYFNTGQPLIADAYIHGQFGPYLRELRAATEELMQAHIIVVNQKTYPDDCREFTEYSLGHAGERFTPTAFSENEKKLLKRLTIDVLTEETPMSVAESTHNHAWRITQSKEHIPLASQVLVNSVPMTTQDISLLKNLVSNGARQ